MLFLNFFQISTGKKRDLNFFGFPAHEEPKGCQSFLTFAQFRLLQEKNSDLKIKDMLMTQHLMKAKNQVKHFSSIVPTSCPHPNCPHPPL